MREINSLTVIYHGRTVGTLAETRDGRGAFQYDRGWLAEGFSISPLSLPLEKKVFLPRSDVLEGLFGVFADSLPDGWGRLLVDRMLLAKKVSPSSVSAIERLSIVGRAGMGALEYFPELQMSKGERSLNLDWLSRECEKILREEKSEDLECLFELGGSSGGARPKVLLNMEGESWIVKFPSTYDRKTIGEEEYCYMKCAGACGISIPEVRLFLSKRGKGYFGTKRFDRENGDKVHMVTVSGLLETSHRTPNLDYMDLMKLTYLLTKDSRQMEELYRRMCFNLYAHNRDDHSKNFTYLYEEKERRWVLSPAYDLTYSSSVGGWHATTVNGQGVDPKLGDLLEVAKMAEIPIEKARRIAGEIEEIVREDLGEIIKSY